MQLGHSNTLNTPGPQPLQAQLPNVKRMLGNVKHATTVCATLTWQAGKVSLSISVCPLVPKGTESHDISPVVLFSLHGVTQHHACVCLPARMHMGIPYAGRGGRMTQHTPPQLELCMITA